MATFQLEFVSPEKLLLSRPVEMALLPAADGQMGVLPGHAPMIVALRGGVISVHEGGAETEALFVPGGFAEITPTRVTVLADEATPVAQLSRADAELRITEAEKALAELQTAEGTTPEKRETAMARLLSARAMLAAAQSA